MSLTKFEAQKRAHDNLVRVIAKQEMKEGRALPNIREAEKKAAEVAQRVDRQKGR